jgi:hypothetical protein
VQIVDGSQQRGALGRGREQAERGHVGGEPVRPPHRTERERPLERRDLGVGEFLPEVPDGALIEVDSGSLAH